MRTVMWMMLAALSAAAQSVPERPARVGVGAIERRLSLEEAIELAVRNNLQVEIQRQNVAAAEQGVLAARGAFDPTLQWRPLFERANTPASSVLQAPGGNLQTSTLNQNLYFNQPFTRYGTRFTASFENARLTTNNPFTTLNPYFNSRFVVGFAQPLLRGLGTDPLRTELVIRQRERSVSQQQLRANVIDVVTRVEQAYWDLLAAYEDVRVRSEAV